MGAVTETQQIAARVPTDLVDRLAAIAEKDDRTLSYIVRAGLKHYADLREGPEKASA